MTRPASGRDSGYEPCICTAISRYAQHGNAILSRYPLFSGVFSLEADGALALVRVNIETGGIRLNFYTTHLFVGRADAP